MSLIVFCTKTIRSTIIHLVGLVSLFLLFSTNISWSQNSINKISILKSENDSSIIFYLNKSPAYKVFALKSPSRLVIDFEDSFLESKINISDSSMFESFRSAKRNDKDLRIVMTLKNDVTVFKSSILNPLKNSDQYRLVIDVQNPKEKINATQSKKYHLTPLNSEIADKILNDPPASVVLVNDVKQQKLVAKMTKIIPVKLETKSDVKSEVKLEVKPENKPELVKLEELVQSKPVIIETTKYHKKVIIIDAGHGGKDPGALGRYYKTKEKMVTLAFAKEIKKYLDKTGQFKVYLTRNDDNFISLQGRVKISRDLKADLFISIHADSAESRDAEGLSIYTLSETSSDKQAARLAKQENKSDIIGGVNFSNTSGDILNTLIALSQRSTMNNSAQFAEFAINSLQNNNINIKQDTHRFAGFRVLTAPDVPSVLIELGYLSNKGDEKKLNSSSYRRKFAKVMSQLIDDYFKL